MVPILPESINPFYEGRKYKLKHREKLLREQPELKREIDWNKVTQISPDLVEVRCARSSSVAKGTAIEGSDIDGGVFISEKEIPEDIQKAIIQELKNQGFSLSHETEEEVIKTPQGETRYRPLDQVIFRTRQAIVTSTDEQGKVFKSDTIPPMYVEPLNQSGFTLFSQDTSNDAG